MSAFVILMQVCRTWQVRAQIVFDVAHAHVPHQTQAMAQPLLFIDLHIYPSDFASLLQHFLMHDRRGSTPGAHTRCLRVREDYSDADAELSAVTALLPFMPNLRSFSSREYSIVSPTLISVGQHAKRTLKTLEIHVEMSDAPGVLAAAAHFSALRTLRIELELYQHEHASLLETSPPLVLARLARFEAVLSNVCLLSQLARWLARCELPVLEHLALVFDEVWMVDSELGMLNDLMPFFAAHQDLRVLSLDACEELTLTLLALELPPGLRRVMLRSPGSLPCSLPALPPALRQLALFGKPGDSSLWDLLAHLLHEPSLPLTEIVVVLEESPTLEHPESVRSFSWREILLPPCRIDTLDDRHVYLCGNMVLYAMRFKQRGISILDEYGCVWPGDGESCQLGF
jgi:hypothetical protein